jgi:hypothetical protein
VEISAKEKWKAESGNFYFQLSTFNSNISLPVAAGGAFALGGEELVEMFAVSLGASTKKVPPGTFFCW